MPSSHPASRPADEPDRRGRFRPARLAALGVVLALAGFWIWAFTLAPDDRVDELQSQTFSDAAARRCEQAMSELDALPFAHQTPDPVERAEVIDDANEILRRMLADLRDEAAPLTGSDQALVDRWLDDWDDYLASRERFAERIREDPEARFTVPSRPGGQITQTMDGFSRTNEMAACFVPDDL